MRSSPTIFKKAYQSVVIGLSPLLVLSIVYAAFATIIMMVLGINPAEYGNTPEVSRLDFIFLIVTFVPSIFVSLAVLRVISNPENVIFESIFNFAKSSALRFLWVSLLYGLVVGVGMILLIIPGIFFAISLIFSQYVALFENLNGSAALQRSYEYVKGRWLNVCGKFIFIGIVGIPLYLVLVFAVSFVTPPDQYSNFFLLTAMGSLLQAVFTAYAYEVYLDVRAPRTPVVVPAPQTTPNTVATP
jgi:hypothetical protein